MEHSRIKKRNVALIEKCVMSSIGIESLFRKFAGNPYKLHTYTSQESFQDAMSRISFAAVIFSFSAMRQTTWAGNRQSEGWYQLYANQFFGSGYGVRVLRTSRH